LFLFTHIFTFIACLAREVFASKTTFFGQVLRIIEIVCIPIYMACIFSSTEWITVIMVREAQFMDENILKSQKVGNLPEFITDKVLTPGFQFLALRCYRSESIKFSGRIREFLWIEIFIYMFFMLTMFLLMIKSRFYSISVDNSYQFEEEYMSLLAERITKLGIKEIVE